MTPAARALPVEGLAADRLETWLPVVRERQPPPSPEQAHLLIAMAQVPTRAWRVGLARRGVMNRMQIRGWVTWRPQEQGWQLTKDGSFLAEALDTALVARAQTGAA